MTALLQGPELDEAVASIERPWSYPAGELVLPADADEADWLRARKTLVGASDLAKMLGHSKYGDQRTVWLDKISDELSEPTSLAQRRGQLFEDGIVKLWAEHVAGFPVKLRRAGLIRSRRAPHVGASVDRLSVCWHDGAPHRCVTEVKSQADMSEWDDNEVPVAFQLQGGGQLAATGREHVHYVVMGPRWRVEHRIIHRDEELIAQIESTTEQWWQTHIVERVEPKATAASLDSLRKLRGEKGTVCEIDDELAPHVHALLNAKQEIEAQQMVVDEAQAVIMQRMGAATELVWPDGATVATWRPERTIDGANKDWKAAHPDLVAAYSEPKPELDVKRLVAEHPELIGAGGLRHRRSFKLA